MKLLTKTTVYFLLIMLPLFAAGAFYLFYQFEKEFRVEMDEELLNDQLQWQHSLDTMQADNPAFQVATPEFSIMPAPGAAPASPEMKDTMMYQEVEQEEVPYRQLRQVITVNRQPYLLTIRKSLLEKNDLISSIGRVMLLALAGLLVFALLLNLFISRRIWEPFYQSLRKIQHVQLDQAGALSFPAVSVYEFSQLNAALGNMARRIYDDYTHMKELTEDAAHEMQTPLAIAQSKLELLLQEAGLQDAQLQLIVQTQEALQRLSRLNQGLLFIAKIENQQYNTDSRISIGHVLQQHLRALDELIQHKQLQTDLHQNGDAQLALHPLLADALVGNLLSNAIRYNYEGGTIRMWLTPRYLIVSNSSRLPAIPATQLFQRFRKATGTASGSNGLGLAIVKKIADTYGLSVDYSYDAGMHTFCVTFP